jgi:hypothetical protein
MSELDGMTVNERIYACGIIGEWDTATERKDLKAITELLRRVELPEADAVAIAESIMKRR